MSKRKLKSGLGFIDNLVDRTPVELHLPGYQFCGPGTKLEKRLERGDSGINPLDKACKEHDIAYSDKNSDRYEADKKLSRAAWDRVKSRDAKFGERASALAVAAAMRVKMKLAKQGGRLKSFAKKKNKSFKSLVTAIKKVVKNKKPSKSSILAAVRAAKSFNRRNCVKVPRVIPIPKSGGALPLIPIFAGLSALGSLTGGVASIVRALRDASAAKDALKEAKYHNRVMEAIGIGKTGSGLYLKPYKNGHGLFLKPYGGARGVQNGRGLYLKPYRKNL